MDDWLPLVSVIVPTCNSAGTLEACLESVRAQGYRNIELIVVDNRSTDTTVEIARRCADIVIEGYGERSCQVNLGWRAASGDFVFRVDSDFTLDRRVVEECVQAARLGADAVVVHNTPDPTISWIARVRNFEVSLYKYDMAHSAARFVRKDWFGVIGGYNESLIAGEDYDFQNRLVKSGARIRFVDAEATHHGEPVSLFSHLKKCAWYGADFVNFVCLDVPHGVAQVSFVRGAFIRNWRRMCSHPVLSIELVGYLTLKYGAGATGFCVGLTKRMWSLKR